jgi:hypothetical protein
MTLETIAPIGDDPLIEWGGNELANELRTAVIAAAGAIAAAVVAAAATIYVSDRNLKEVTSGLLRYVYDNGSITSASYAGGKLVFKVNGSSNGAPVSVKLDMNRLLAMCGDADGCSLTLGATRFRHDADLTYVVEAPLQGAPCRFFYTASHHWSLSQACVAKFGVYDWDAQKKNWEFKHVYQVYEYSNAYGIDDSFHDGSDKDGQPLIVMSFKGACYLAESAADAQRGGGQFLPDNPADLSTGRGLYLVASSPSWDYAGSYPKDATGAQTLWPANDPERQCVLVVED